MLSYQSGYNGTKQEGLIQEFYSRLNVYVVLSFSENTDQPGDKLIAVFIEQIQNASVHSLHELDTAVTHAFHAANLPVDTSVSLGFLVKSILYVKTIGRGKVMMMRNGVLETIITGNNNASGYVRENDVVIFCTETFSEAFPNILLKRFVSPRNLDTVVEQLDTQISEGRETGIALFVGFKADYPSVDSFDEQSLREKYQGLQEQAPQSFLSIKFQDLVARLKLINQHKNKKVTMIVVVVIVAILIWSVMLGYQRRQDAILTKQIKTSREIITQKLEQSEEVSFLNMARSQILIAESRAELELLKTKVGSSREKEVSALGQLIQTKEDEITKKEEKTPEEFYDLTIDTKQAKGTKLGLREDILAILDTSNKAVYLLSLSKKSLVKLSALEAARATLVVPLAEGVLLYIPDDGVYKVIDTGSKKVINKDDEWGTITDMALYNTNVYALDAVKKQVYKYLSSENGYSTKSAYITGERPIGNVKSLAIDSSVFIGGEEVIYKYTGGVRDGFATEYPDATVSIHKIMTSKDTEKVYIWDKQKGAVYVLTKAGSYERQIKSNILTKSSDVLLYDDKAFILQGEKIYSLSLQ